MSHPAPLQRMPLRYHGGKWRLAPWIISHFPKHVCYVEPYSGSASVLLRKPISPIEVYNDMDGGVVNFFKVLREQPNDLCRAIELTPWSREELAAAAEPCDDALEWARRRYVRSFQSRSQTNTKQSPGWKFQKSMQGMNVIRLWNDASHLMLAAQRIKEVHIEQDEALQVIQRYDTSETLFYIDPPYLYTTRHRSWAGRAYAHEMDIEAHEALAEIIHHVQGMVVLSGYDSELYQSLYSDWNTVSHASTDGAGNQRKEMLWLNPAVSNALSQLTLFMTRGGES